jgi:hypothetical protein
MLALGIGWMLVQTEQNLRDHTATRIAENVVTANELQDAYCGYFGYNCYFVNYCYFG